MSGEIVHGREVREDRRASADVVVCGGGAGGCMAARELARAGLDVLLLEEGAHHRTSDFTQREDEMLPLLFQESAGRRTDDLAIPILSGRGLGGSTVHNQNLCKRAPSVLLDRWRDDLGIDGVGASDLSPFYDEVERDLGVRRIEDRRVNAHNHAFDRGRTALGWSGGRLSHNRDERCIGSGFCELGCAYDGKLNALRVLVPEALAAGADVYTDCRVDTVVHDGRRVSGVHATLLDTERRELARLEVRARAVCLAGSAIGSAALALASGVPDSHRVAGRGLRLHPGAIVAGVLDEPVEGWRGVPQSVECTEHLDFAPDAERRVWLVPSFAHPIGTAALMPGFGPALHREMRRYRRLAVVAAMVHDETSGRVELDGGRTRISYVPTRGDREQLALGCREGARLLFAAGATECLVPAIPPIVVRSERELGTITADRFAPHDARLTAVHPMGTLALSASAEHGFTAPSGESHALRGLWVVDGSLFPTSIGVPPQISIFAFAMKVARTLAAELGARG